MLEYGNLSPLEFEYVCQDVMQAKLGTALRRFPAGRDDGIDLIDDLETNHIVVQVKHYWKSSFSALKQALKAERAKVDRLSPGQYYLCCGQTLTPNQTRELYDLFSDYMASEQNILTLLELDEFLTAPQNVGLLRKHFKLWLSASSILSELYNQEIFIDSEALLYDVADELPYYVQTGSYLKSRDILERERLLMIVGSPGVGKTTISKMLVLYFASIGYRVRYTTNGDLSGIKRAISADHSKEIILLDDCLGQCYFRLKDTQENELSTLIKFVKRNPGKILLLNSRITIFNEAREHSVEFSRLFDSSVVQIRRINAEDIPPEEKALILYSLMRRFQVPDQYYQSIRKGKNYRRIVNHQNYNPRIIEYAAWRYRDAGAPEGFFDFLMDKLETPKNVWKEEFERRMDRVDRYFMYTLYSLTSVKARVEYDHLEKAFRKVLEVIEADISGDQFENTLARLSRSLVRIVSDNKKTVHTREPYYTYYVRGEDRREISVLNPSINDYLQEVFKARELRSFFKAHAYYLEQIIQMCETKEEVETEVRRLAEAGELIGIHAIDPDLTQSLVLYFVVTLELLDEWYEPLILPGLHRFPSHYYVSREFMLSHQKLAVIQALWREPLYSFYHIFEKVNCEEGVKALCGSLHLEDLITLANELDRRLSFRPDWTRERFIEILRDELEDAGQCYLDRKTLDYSENGDEESFDSYCDSIEDEIYDLLWLKLEIPELAEQTFGWMRSEWAPSDSMGWEDREEASLFTDREIDLILDRSLT